jgi:two-component system sensor histidine kinase FlrB
MPLTSSAGLANPAKGESALALSSDGILAKEQNNSMSEDPPLDLEKMQQAFAQLNRLSENFVQSYQSLEDQVESLAQRLAREVQNKELELLEKEKVASRLQNLLAILPTGVVVLDAEGRVQDCNAVAVDLLGRPLLGEQWITIINRCFSPRLDDGHEISLKDGRRVRIETRALDYEPGQLIVLTDMTETRRLQDRVNQDRRLSSMGKMMAALAHQIRTPLSSAILYAEGLSKPNLQPDKQQKFSSQLIACLSHLERHINDMLQFARCGGLKREVMSAAQCISLLSEHLGEQYPQVNIQISKKFQSAESWFLRVNTDALYSAIRNLIDNAIQATAGVKQPRVLLTIGCTHSAITFSVEDNGCGIKEPFEGKIFEPFFTTKQGGSGLGLAVVHGVVKAHEGKVSVQSQPGKTVITTSIPLVESA